MDKLAKQFAELAEKVGPEAIRVAREAARMEALSCLAGSVMWFGIAASLFYAGRFLAGRAGKNDWDENWFIVAVFAFIVAGFVMLPGIWAWIDPWTWTALSQPELWVAKRVLKL